jgi:hypothetical protein
MTMAVTRADSEFAANPNCKTPAVPTSMKNTIIKLSLNGRSLGVNIKTSRTEYKMSCSV